MIGNRELTLDDYLAILRRHKWLLILSAVLGTAGAYAVSWALPSRYSSETLVLVEQPTVPDSYVKPVVAGNLSRRLASMQEQILSRTRLQQIVEQYNLYKKDSGGMSMEESVEQLRKSITVTPLKPIQESQSRELPGFTVSVVADRAQLAQQICTEITSIFMQQNIRIRQQQAEDTTQFLGKQLEEAKAKLDERDAALAVFKRRYIGELPDDQQTNLNLLAGMAQRLDAVTQALSRAEQEKTFTESVLSQQLASLKSAQQGQSPETLEQQVSSLQNQLVSLEARYTESHPDVIKAKNDIAQLKKKMGEGAARIRNQPANPRGDDPLVEPAEIQQLRAQLHQSELAIRQKAKEQEQLQEQMKALQARIQLSPVVEQEYKSLTRDYQTALEIYNDLLKKQNQSEMATDLERRQQGEQFRVLDPPSLPQEPSFPKRPLFALGGLGGGLFLGLVIAYALEVRDTTLRTDRDVELMLKVPALALIPSLQPLDGKVHPALLGNPGAAPGAAKLNVEV